MNAETIAKNKCITASAEDVDIPKVVKSMDEQKTLKQHRKDLKDNKEDRFTRDKERAIAQFAETSYKHYGRCGKNKKLVIQLLKQLGKLVFENQKDTPLYEYTDDPDDLPRSWNSPMKGGWEVDYIKWEIGHLESQNQGGTNKPENLSFQSARCNQHIQTSMNYSETTEYKYIKEVQNRVDNLFILHRSKEWMDILDKINSILHP
tara:strand:- start:475 stop:1089 length:615 start_codon:yes stop_codon:yes gene_type:complete